MVAHDARAAQELVEARIREAVAFKNLFGEVPAPHVTRMVARCIDNFGTHLHLVLQRCQAIGTFCAVFGCAKVLDVRAVVACRLRHMSFLAQVTLISATSPSRGTFAGLADAAT
jgi:hypothetical protein